MDDVYVTYFEEEKLTWKLLEKRIQISSICVVGKALARC